MWSHVVPLNLHAWLNDKIGHSHWSQSNGDNLDIPLGPVYTDSPCSLASHTEPNSPHSPLQNCSGQKKYEGHLCPPYTHRIFPGSSCLRTTQSVRQNTAQFTLCYNIMTDCGVWTIREIEALTLSAVIVRCEMLDSKPCCSLFIQVLNKGTGCKKFNQQFKKIYPSSMYCSKALNHRFV